MFETKHWREIGQAPLTPGTSLTSADLAPDKTTFIVASESGEVFRIDTSTGRPVGTPLIARGTQLQRAVFSRDGSLIAALGRDGKLQIWDVKSGRPLGPALASHDGYAVALAPEGQHGFVSAGIDIPSIVHWSLDPSTWVKQACDRVRRNLTPDEWKTQIGDEHYRRTCTGTPSTVQGR